MSFFDDDPFFNDFFGPKKSVATPSTAGSTAGGGPGGRPGGGRRSDGRNDRNDRQIQRRPSDPFAAMDQRMSALMGRDPFGGGGLFGRDPFGGPFGGGDPFGDMTDMSAMQTSGSRSSSRAGPVFSSSSSMVVSSRMGPDGKMHTEKYSSSAVRDGQRDAFEQQQAYSNSSSGVDKMALERQQRGKGRKMVKEYNHGTQEDRQTEYLRGLEDHEKDDFDVHWQREVAPHMPRHSQSGRGGSGSGAPLGLGNRGNAGGGRGSRRSQQEQPALRDR